HADVGDRSARRDVWKRNRRSDSVGRSVDRFRWRCRCRRHEWRSVMTWLVQPSANAALGDAPRDDNPGDTAMTIGPGVYDEECTLVRRRTDAKGVVVIVVGGDRGAGFAVQATPEATLDLP